MNSQITRDTRDTKDTSQVQYPSTHISEPPENLTLKQKLADFFKFVGPGFLISIACLDPGNLSGDIAVGQATRFRLFWLLILSHVMCYYFQTVAVSIGTYLSLILRLCYWERHCHSLQQNSFQKGEFGPLGYERACIDWL